MSKKSKSSSTTNETSHQVVTSTPTNPQWVEDSTKALQTRINGLLDKPASSFVPGASALQQQAYAGASRLMGGGSAPMPAGYSGGNPGAGAYERLVAGGAPVGGAAAQPAINAMWTGGTGYDPTSGGYTLGAAPAGATPQAGDARAMLDSIGAGNIAVPSGLGGGKPLGGMAGTSPVADVFGGDGSQFAGDAKRAYILANGGGSPGGAGGLLNLGGAAPAAPVGANWRDGNGAAQNSAASLMSANLNPATARLATAQAGTATAADPVTAALASSRGLLDVNLDGYMNPLLDRVVSTTLAGNDEQTAMKRAAMAASQAAGQKFSGSGSAIERALFERGALTDRAGLEANLRSDAFDKATGLATTDLNREADTSRFNAGQTNTVNLAEAGRRDEMARYNTSQLNSTSQFNAGQANDMSQFNAGQRNDMSKAQLDARLRATSLLGDLSNQSSANERADLGLLSDMGDKQREVERQQLGAEPEMLKLIAALNSSQPYNLYHGGTAVTDGNSTSNSTSTQKISDPWGTASNLLQSAGSAASGLAALGMSFSDRTLKTGIKRVGKDGAGRTVYNYRYKGEPRHVTRTGYMAQDLLRSDPEAVVRGPGGKLMVDYGLLGGA